MSGSPSYLPTYDEIREMAELISRWRDTYDELVWLMAEAELKMQSGSQPSHDEIAKLAEQIALRRPTPQELHWFLAERYLYLVKKEQAEADAH